MGVALAGLLLAQPVGVALHFGHGQGAAVAQVEVGATAMGQVQQLVGHARRVQRFTDLGVGDRAVPLSPYCAAMRAAVSSMRLAKPHSLSHHSRHLIRRLWATRVSALSTTTERGSWLKSMDTRASSV